MELKRKLTKDEIEVLLYTKNRCMAMANTKKKYDNGFPRIVYSENEEYRCYRIEVSKGEKLRYFCYDGEKREDYKFVYKKLTFFQKLKGITFKKKCKKMEENLNFLIEVIKNREPHLNILENHKIIKYNEVVK